MHAIDLFLMALACYAVIGLCVGIPFVIWGVRRVDSVAAEASMRVRLLFLPGAAAVWPVTLALWARARSTVTLGGHRESTP